MDVLESPFVSEGNFTLRFCSNTGWRTKLVNRWLCEEIPAEGKERNDSTG